MWRRLSTWPTTCFTKTRSEVTILQLCLVDTLTGVSFWVRGHVPSGISSVFLILICRRTWEQRITSWTETRPQGYVDCSMTVPPVAVLAAWPTWPRLWPFMFRTCCPAAPAPFSEKKKKKKIPLSSSDTAVFTHRVLQCSPVRCCRLHKLNTAVITHQILQYLSIRYYSFHPEHSWISLSFTLCVWCLLT